MDVPDTPNIIGTWEAVDPSGIGRPNYWYEITFREDQTWSWDWGQVYRVPRTDSVKTYIVAGEHRESGTWRLAYGRRWTSNIFGNSLTDEAWVLYRTILVSYFPEAQGTTIPSNLVMLHSDTLELMGLIWTRRTHYA